MQSWKALTLILLLGLLAFPAAAEEQFRFFPENNQFNAEYTGTGDDGRFDVQANCENTEGNTCDAELNLQVCGVTREMSSSESTGGEDVYTENNIDVPQDAPCGYGNHNLRVVNSNNGNTVLQGTLTINTPRNNPNTGDYLVIRADTGTNPWTIRKFELTDNPPNGVPSKTDDQGGWTYIVEQDSPDGNEGAAYKIGNPYAGPPEETDSDPPSTGVSEDKGAIIGFNDRISNHIYCGGEAGTTKEDELNGNQDVSEFCKVNTGRIHDGYCSDDPCEIVQEQFFGHTQWNYHSNTNLNPRSPANHHGGFAPQGELAVGYNEPSSDQKRFHVCREDSEGEVVDLYPSYSQFSELYKCDDGSTTFRAPDGTTNDRITWDWDRVAECDDNLDNDGDGATDYPDDTSCTSQTDNTEGGCEPVIYRDSSGQIYARYGGGSMGDGTNACAGDQYTETRLTDYNAAGNEPQTFTCDQSNIQSEFCSSRNRIYSAHDGEIAGVQYYPTREYFEALLAEGEHSLQLQDPHKKMMQRFVNRNGWNAPKMAVDAGAWGVESNQLYGPSTTGDAHDENYWFNPPMDMVDGDGSGYTQGSFDDSWITAKAGAEHENVGDSRFPGGFAGQCSNEMRWAYEGGQDGGGWQCSAGPPWPQAVMLPEITTSGQEATIGLIVMPYNWKDSTTVEEADLGMDTWKEAWNEFYEETPSSEENLAEIRAACYPSESFDLEIDDTITVQNDGAERGVDYFVDNKDIDTSRDQPLSINGEVNIRNNNTYTCKWKYFQEGNDEIHNGPIDAGTLIPLQRDGNYSGVNAAEARQHFTSEYDGLSASYGSDGISNCC